MKLVLLVSIFCSCHTIQKRVEETGLCVFVFRSVDGLIHSVNIDPKSGNIIGIEVGSFTSPEIEFKELTIMAQDGGAMNSIVWNKDTLLKPISFVQTTNSNFESRKIDRYESLKIQYIDKNIVVMNYRINYYDGAASGINYNQSLVFPRSINQIDISLARSSMYSGEQRQNRMHLFEMFGVVDFHEVMDNEYFKMDLSSGSLIISYTDFLKGLCTITGYENYGVSYEYRKDKNDIFLLQMKKSVKLPTDLKNAELIGII